jgi:hypothetical protein
MRSNDNSPLSFTKAIYNKPDLLEVARRDGANLMPLQQAQLFQALASNDEVFKGGQGTQELPLVSDSRMMQFLVEPKR